MIEFLFLVNVFMFNVVDGLQVIWVIVCKLCKYGVEVIKFCGIGGVFFKIDLVGVQQYLLEEMKVFVDEVYMFGLKVVVYVYGISGIKDVICVGVDIIEYVSFVDVEVFEFVKQYGIWFLMDIYNDDYIFVEGEKNGFFKELLDKECVIGLKQWQIFQVVVKVGVKMIFGIDGGVYLNGDNVCQFVIMVQWGMMLL